MTFFAALSGAGTVDKRKPVSDADVENRLASVNEL
jgi:hypothetical protein